MHVLYANSFVRRRFADFLESDRAGVPTAVYLMNTDGSCYQRQNLRSPAGLEWFLERDLDVTRSLADTESLLFHLDVEYVNFDAPAEAFVHPLRSFNLQEPVVKSITTLLESWDIRPLQLITGQGHHFVWRIPRSSGIAARIAALAPDPELVEACIERVPAGTNDIDRGSQGAFSAMALLMEYVAHRARAAAAPCCEVPVEITAVHVGSGRTGQREIVSIDTSEYGDPLHTRMIRLPFTCYRKPWATGLVQAAGLENVLKPMWVIPLAGMDVREALTLRQSEAAVAALARAVPVRIPDEADGTESLLEDYLHSPLRRFHEYFYAAAHDPPERWPETYSRTPLDDLPVCVKHMSLHPNDLLLKPAGIQIVTRVLLAHGWHPRHIAGFIRSKFENPEFHWGLDWNDYEPATRADFYVRLFSGLYATGIDELVDMNCISTREKGFCFLDSGGCCGLESARHQLLSSCLPL